MCGRGGERARRPCVPVCAHMLACVGAYLLACMHQPALPNSAQPLTEDASFPLPLSLSLSLFLSHACACARACAGSFWICIAVGEASGLGPWDGAENPLQRRAHRGAHAHPKRSHCALQPALAIVRVCGECLLLNVRPDAHSSLSSLLLQTRGYATLPTLIPTRTTSSTT